MIKTSQCVPASKIGYVMWYVTDKMGGDVTKSPFADFQVAYQQWLNLAAPAASISQAQSVALARIKAAIANTKSPSDKNRGFQTGDSSFSVGYSDLPSTSWIVSSLGPANAGRAVTVSVSLSYESSTASNFSIGGKAGFSVPLDSLSIDVGASAKYDLSKLNSLGQSMSISLTYPSITIVGSSAVLLAKDNQSGWYDGSIIHQLVENTGVDTTGYALVNSQFSVAETFGPGKTFARAKTLVLSQMPTVVMVFHNATLATVQSYFKESASVSMKLFGFIPLGSASQSYSVSSMTQDQKTGDVSVTLSPPSISGTIPWDQQTCNVLGGVVDYPS
jgi:hypothetical protein